MKKIIITIIIFCMMNMSNVFAKTTVNTNKAILPPTNIFVPFLLKEYRTFYITNNQNRKLKKENDYQVYYIREPEKKESWYDNFIVGAFSGFFVTMILVSLSR